MAKKGAMKRDPKVSIQPVKTGGEQKISRTPREKAMERLSPGVYRGAQGGLVTQAGRPIERQPQAPMAQPTQQVMPQGQPPMEEQFFQPSPGDVGQQVNKPFPMDGLGNFNPGSIGKTPPGWSGGQMNDMMMRYPMPQGMPQMPQPSANQGGQYRLSPGMYGTREQAMQQYNQQMQQMYQPVNGLGQQGNMPPMDWSSWGPMVPYGQRRG
jgi:hypothetical protein